MSPAIEKHGEGWIGLRIGGFDKYFSPESGFRTKCLRISGPYDHSWSRFYPVLGPGFWILVVGKLESWISTFPRKSQFLSFISLFAVLVRLAFCSKCTQNFSRSLFERAYIFQQVHACAVFSEGIFLIVVPRGRDPFGQHQESRALATPNTGSLAFHGLIVKCDKSDWMKIIEIIFCASSRIGTGQRSRFFVLTKRIAATEDENGIFL